MGAVERVDVMRQVDEFRLEVGQVVDVVDLHGDRGHEAGEVGKDEAAVQKEDRCAGLERGWLSSGGY